jgi:hypothetical protein
MIETSAVSVIIPIRNAASTLDACLRALASGSVRPLEVLVADDRSTDDGPARAAAAGARVIRSRGVGPAAARNTAAAEARGEVLLFLDADVLVRPDTIERVLRRLTADPDVAAVFGSYDASPAAPNFFSQYRNLLHHFTHQRSREWSGSFWAGCGAVRAAAFRGVGGFDERRYPRASIEDIELGGRLGRAGCRILLDKSLQVTHLKRWSWLSTVKTDVRDRAIPWTRLLLSNRAIPDDLNLRTAHRLSVVASGLLPMAVLVAIGAPLGAGAGVTLMSLAVAAALVGVLIVLNRDFYAFLVGARGWRFTAAAAIAHWTYYLYSGAAFAIGVLARVRAGAATAAAFVLLTLLHTWPIARAPGSLIDANPDTQIHLWSLNEMARQVNADPLHPFEGNIFHPYSHTLGVVDHVLVNAVVAAPFRAVTANPVLVHNITLLATFALSGVFTALLVRRLCGSWTGGLVAGSAFAFCAMRFRELPHLHVLSIQWLPLALLALHRFIERPGWWRTAGLTAAGAVVALSSWHAAVIGGTALLIVAAWSLAATRGGILMRLRRLAAAALVVAALTAPIAAIYAELGSWRPPVAEETRERRISRLALPIDAIVPRHLGLGRPLRDGRADLETTWAFPGYVTCLLAAAAFWTRTTTGAGRGTRVLAAALGVQLFVVAAAIWAAITGRDAFARALAPLAPIVVVAAGGAALGLLAARRIARRAAGGPTRADETRVTYAALASGGLLLALGPIVRAWDVDLGSGVYRDDWLGVLSILRAPDRFALLFVLGAAVLAGLGAHRIAQRLPARVRWVGVTAMLVLLNVDLRVAPLGVVAAPRPDRSDWLATIPTRGAIVEYPVRSSLSAMLAGFDHDRRLVNGAGYVSPPEYRSLRREADLSDAQLEILWEHFHPALVVIRGDRYTPAELAAATRRAAERPDALKPLGRFGADFVYGLTDRGRGPVLRRRWPQEALAASRGIALAAVVPPARSGRTSRLVVTLGAHTLLDVEGDAASRASPRRLSLQPEWLVPGANAVDIRADYRYAAATPPNAVGGTGTSVPADLRVASDRRRAWIQVNGESRPASRGYFLVVLDGSTGRIVASDSFDTSRAAESGRLAEFVRALPTGAPVLIATESAMSASRAAIEALRTLGLRADLEGRTDRAHAAIGVKGASPGTAVESAGTRSATVTVGSPESPEVQILSLELY